MLVLSKQAPLPKKQNEDHLTVTERQALFVRGASPCAATCLPFNGGNHHIHGPGVHREKESRNEVGILVAAPLLMHGENGQAVAGS